MQNPSSYYKTILFQHCLAYVDSRIETAQQAMNYAQAAANEEGKSSAGDKYETGRAMMQIERDKAAQQLDEALKLRKQLEGIKTTHESTLIRPGCIVLTDHVNFYIAISAGRIQAGEKEFIAIAPNAPMANTLVNLKQGDRFPFNGKPHTILEIR
jgi:hypothetical protein